MRNHAEFVSQAQYSPTIHDLKNTSFGHDCGIGTLIENAPLGERWFLDTHPLSSSPGQAPTQEESCLSEGNVAAVAHFGDDLLR